MFAMVEAMWTWLLTLGPTPVVVAVGSFLMITVPYLVHGLAHLYLDVHQWPAYMPALARKRFFTRVLTCLTAAPFAFACGLGGVYLHAARWLYKHKLQPDVKLDTSVLPRMWKTLVFSMVVVIVPLCVMEGYFASIGRLRTSPELPGFKELLLHMVAFTLIEEVMFYYAHRLLHVRMLYQYIHKQHHEFKAPIALAAGYAHPVEVLVGNTLPIFLSPVLLGVHVCTMWLWFFSAVIVVQVHHSGYRFPWHVDHQPDFHDFHHCKDGFHSNFGLLGVLDWLHSTDVKYRKLLAQGKEASKES